MACKPLLSLCSIPKTAMKDGWAAATAKLLLPFYGYWFPSGAQYAFPQSVVGQDQSVTISGSNTPDVFQKDCCTCGPCAQGGGSGNVPSGPPGGMT